MLDSSINISETKIYIMRKENPLTGTLTCQSDTSYNEIHSPI